MTKLEFRGNNAITNLTVITPKLQILIIINKLKKKKSFKMNS